MSVALAGPLYADRSFVGDFETFCLEHLVQSTDVFAGHPLELEPWQVDFLAEALAWRDDGEPYWQSVVLVVARKNGKTSLLAAYALYRLLADPGTPEILLAASSDGQAGRLFDAAKAFVQRSPTLREVLNVRGYDGKILRADGGGEIHRLASDPNRLHGYNPSLVILDELAAWRTPRLREAHGILTSGGGARRVAQTFTISVAGEAHERTSGILGQLIDGNQLVGELERPSKALTISRNHRARVLVYNYSAPTSDPADVDALKLANPASWITPDYLARQAANPELTDAKVLQLHGCVWAAAEESWLGRGPWLDCAHPELEVELGELITLGFDGAMYEDATALLGSRLEDGHVFTLGVWQKPHGAAGRGWEVPRLEVSAAVEEAFELYEIVRMYADPPEWWTELAEWSRTWPGRVVAYKTNRRGKMADAVDRFQSAVLAGALSHDDHPRLTEHVLNARRHPTPSGVMIRKDRPDSPRKIDAAVAAILAYEARADALELGLGRRRGKVVAY